MRRPLRLLVAAAALLLCGAPGAPARADAAANPACLAAAHAFIPERDRPTPKQAAALAGCDAEALYYGIDRAPDYVRARHCAILQPVVSDDAVFEGGGILMMLYANGLGGEKNFDIATRMACAWSFAPTELELRLEHLRDMKQGKDKEPIDICDDMTSGIMSAYCYDHARRLDAPRERAYRQALYAGWTKAQRSALRPLEKARKQFVETRIDHEVDLSGTLRWVFRMAEEDALQQEFDEAMERLNRRELPAASADAAARARAELDAVYRGIQAAPDSETSTVTRAGVAATQRAYRRYRDAWVAFGAKVHPAVPAHAWEAWLDGIRTKQLQKIGDPWAPASWHGPPLQPPLAEALAGRPGPRPGGPHA